VSTLVIFNLFTVDKNILHHRNNKHINTQNGTHNDFSETIRNQSTYSQGTSPTITKSPSSSSYVSTWHLSGCTPFISVPPVNNIPLLFHTLFSTHSCKLRIKEGHFHNRLWTKNKRNWIDKGQQTHKEW